MTMTSNCWLCGHMIFWIEAGVWRHKPPVEEMANHPATVRPHPPVDDAMAPAERYRGQL